MELAAAAATSTNSCSGAALTAAERKLKCRKCRQELLQQPPHRLLEEEDEGAAGGAETAAVYSLQEEVLPDWIDTAIEQGGWTKGKLMCPGCGARVGGFDYVGGHAKPVYIVRSKVDLLTPRPLVNALLPGATSGRCEGVNAGDPVKNSVMESDVSEDEDVSESGAADPLASSSTDHTDHESSEEAEEESHVPLRAKSRKEKWRRRRMRREQRLKARETEETNRRRNYAKVEAKLAELLAGEPELDQLADDVICPVCLDLLHEPFQTDPCGHIFCEPCLRRLGHKNPMNTRCPLCRTRIGFCKHLAATSREIREEYEALYLKRKKFEKSTPVFSYPLPWTPGWRNLIRGRPLGGNRLLIRNNQADYLRALLHQLPYYIPPILFANLVNILIFAVMMGAVEILPNLLVMLSGTWKEAAVEANITDLVPEISGEQMPPDEETSVQAVLVDAPVVIENVGPEALDTTFYYILFIISVIGAGLGQVFLNQYPGEDRQHYRIPDILLVIGLTCLPLLVIPTILPFRNPEGYYLGHVLKKTFYFILNHLSFHTIVLLSILAWFVYHCETNEDILG